MSLFVSPSYAGNANDTWSLAMPTPAFEPPPVLAQLPPTLPSARELNVFVIDDFKSPSINISRADTVSDLSHGAVVESIIRRGLPDANITRVNNAAGSVAGGARQASVALGDTLDQILAQQAAAQGVPRSKVDLSNFVVNLSQSDATPMSAEARARLSALTTEFSQRGGRIYVAAGNSKRNDIIDLPGVTGVDGSEGVIGRTDNRTASPQYNNGNVPNVANSLFAPFHRGDGSIQPFADSTLRLPPGSEAKPPPAPFSGRTVADAVVDPRAVAGPLRRLEELTNQQQKLLLPYVDGKPMPPAAEQRVDALERERERIYAQLSQLMQGKLVPLSIVPLHAETNPSYGGERVPRDVDRSKVYIDGRAFTDSIDPRAGYTLYEGVGGVLRPLAGPGEGVTSSGTSWATPNFLVEQEIDRLRRRSPAR